MNRPSKPTKLTPGTTTQGKRRRDDPLHSGDPAAKRHRGGSTVDEDIGYVDSNAGSCIETKIGAQFVRVEGTLFQVSTSYLQKISDVFDSMDKPPMVWKINGITDARVFLETVRCLHPVGDRAHVQMMSQGWSPRPVLDYLGTPWARIIDSIKRLETVGEYEVAATFLHALDRKRRTSNKWHPRTITHWLTSYALLEPDDAGDWIDIDDIVNGCIKQQLTVHEMSLFNFLFGKNDNGPYSKAMVGVLRRWPETFLKASTRHMQERFPVVE
jgi:hypothetical protein